MADEPLFEFADPEAHIEDAYIWEENGKFQMIFKDRTDRITGEEHAGTHATSSDAIRWELSDPPKAYSRTVRWSDGEITTLGSLERPQLLIQNGRPTHLFAGCADGPGGFWRAEKTWNQCIPFRGAF
ncbi:MAG: hypothetical protein ACLFWL_12130 [Candidatus Brocadiia bacterium]